MGVCAERGEDRPNFRVLWRSETRDGSSDEETCGIPLKSAAPAAAAAAGAVQWCRGCS